MSSQESNCSFSTAPVLRRSILRGAGFALALPFLSGTDEASGTESDARALRMVLISNNLGVLPKLFFPEDTGKEYGLSPYLKELAEFRSDFTVFSGLSHPGVEGGHSTENCFLTAARGPTKSGFRNHVSFDQFVAEKIGERTRFPSISLGVNIDKANRSLSWTRDGSLIPVEDSPRALFQKMFLQGDANEVRRQVDRLEEKKSILDALLEQSSDLERQLGSDDRKRIDQYFNSIREVESRLQTQKKWEIREKPTSTAAIPEDIPDQRQFFEKFDLMLRMTRLALESDSTRIVTIMVDAFATPVFQLHPNQVTSDGYHNLSHHGQEPDKVAQLEDADRQQMQLLQKFLRGLASTPSGEGCMLDSTMVLFGSNMGDANTHDNTNLPILLAGGRLKHGQHWAYPRDRNLPLSNLYVAMAQQLGLEVDTFGSSTGVLSEVL